MADTIIKAGRDVPTNTPIVDQPENPQYLEVLKYLEEYADSIHQDRVRSNIGVYGTEQVYTKDEVNSQISSKLKESLANYLGKDGLSEINEKIDQIFSEMVKTDGTKPFTNPQKGVKAVSDNELTTLKQIKDMLSKYITSIIFNDTVSELENSFDDKINTINDKIVKLNQDQKTNSENLKNYIKLNGTSPFTKPQFGVDPTEPRHLATKKYIDSLLINHKTDIDPHGFLTILKSHLQDYVKSKDVYKKYETYSRTDVDEKVRKFTEQYVDSYIEDTLSEINERLENIRQQRYIKQDGSIPFKNTQAGVDAINPNELTTLQQVETLINTLKEQLTSQITSKECEWKTSGPVISSVGLVETGTELSNTVSFQELMDRIFYGKGINIITEELVSIGSTTEITVCAQGSLAEFDYGEIYQNGIKIYEVTKNDFKDSSCITVPSNVILENTEFIFKVYYINGSFHEVSSITKVSMPVFVGIIPEWKLGLNITYDYLISLSKKDKVNNKFYDKGAELTTLNHKFDFKDLEEKKRIILAIPITYPNLYQMMIPSQQFNTEAFNILELPFQVPGIESDVLYRLYIYKEGIVQLNNPVTFNFITE